MLAHEFGHAIQARTDDFDRNLPTIHTEQQADCFAGAWLPRWRRRGVASRSATPTSDRPDRDDHGARPHRDDPFEEGGHGSAFDRIGAFQIGFTDGIARCADLTDDPLPLVPNLFNPYNSTDELTQGNAPFGYGDDQLMACCRPDLIDFLAARAGLDRVSRSP